MAYELEFHPKALKEWQKLDASIKTQFKKKLAQRLKNPKVPKDQLRGYEAVYKIKLQKSGFRLAYEVQDNAMIIFVVGKREDEKVYNLLKQRHKI
ncbi:type II toxin-antitoxin system RelE family toxin [Candidatus Spongiihabitans sp.]|uniref:type II toxin-antitoxin system RelE family toxin n=1 Tax=Candidatus Spongiihabitans sp. TaxID=3101308 RepID=UPI003C7D3789